jgi:hypothetical protein
VKAPTVLERLFARAGFSWRKKQNVPKRPQKWQFLAEIIEIADFASSENSEKRRGLAEL